MTKNQRIFRICIVGITLFVGACGGENRGVQTAPSGRIAPAPAVIAEPVAAVNPPTPAADCDAPKPKPVAFAMCTE